MNQESSSAMLKVNFEKVISFYLLVLATPIWCLSAFSGKNKNNRTLKVVPRETCKFKNSIIVRYRNTKTASRKS